MADNRPTDDIFGCKPFVDGLRAVSILAVVTCHAGMPGIRGGFVGVDVFFVISGYLIINQIAAPELLLVAPNCVARAASRRIDPDKCAIRRQAVDNYRRPTIATLRYLAGQFPDVRFIDPIDVFCDNALCRPSTTIASSMSTTTTSARAVPGNSMPPSPTASPGPSSATPSRRPQHCRPPRLRVDKEPRHDTRCC